MSTPTPPIPKPRIPNPQSPTKPPERAPPQLPPKTGTASRSESFSQSVEIIKHVFERPQSENYAGRPPLLHARRPRQRPEDEFETVDTKTLSNWHENMTPWGDVCRELKLRGVSEAECIRVKAYLLQKAAQHYIEVMDEHGDTIKQYIDDLHSVAENLDKVSKGTKIAGITGGATSVAGGVAAAAGVILSPFTLGASLALTAVGVGVAAAGGVTGASAAIANKVNAKMDQKKLQRILQDHESLCENIQQCLKFIAEGMDRLAQHGQSVLKGIKVHPEKGSRIVKLVADGEISALALEESSKASGVIKGFFIGMDFYFTEGKDGQKVKKGLESKLAKKIRELTEALTKGLDEFIKLKDLFSKEG